MTTPTATTVCYAAELSSAMADAVATGAHESRGAREGEEGLTARRKKGPWEV